MYLMTDGIMKKYPRDVVIQMCLQNFLLRFKCVSKTVCALIQSSTFINLHLNHSTTSTDGNILLKRSFKEDIEIYKAIFSFISSDCEDYLKFIYPELVVPYITNRLSITSDKLIGPSHGLIALMDPITTILFNPSTRNYRLLPSSPFDVPKGFHRSIASGGFGFDSVVNDFKVFRIIQVYTEDRFGYPEKGEKKVEVYELGIDIWRELDHVDQQLPKLFWLTSSIFYKGAYHWITSSREFKPTILCFDMSTEIFRNMEPPNTREFSSGTIHSLLILTESLCLTCYPCLGPMIDPANILMEIWIMKDYNVYESWIKKYTIRGLPTESPLAIWKDCLLLFQSKSGYLMLYDLNSDEIKELNFHGCLKSMRVIIYKESMTPIPKGSQRSTQVENF
ncbi:F-box protein CPR1-like [Lycium ferocissimum]|uniref:F-box protein CPR1-like n=1 Tax=Lycium ferocissimum TaxID=112874 RepID=UPI00281550EA|nr:F-box protein CPR1-like [Lycium ferocissimum]